MAIEKILLARIYLTDFSSSFVSRLTQRETNEKEPQARFFFSLFVALILELDIFDRVFV